MSMTSASPASASRQTSSRLSVSISALASSTISCTGLIAISSVSYRCAVLAGVRRAFQNTVLPDADGLRPAERPVRYAHLVAHLRKLGAHGLVIAFLHFQHPCIRETARRVDGGLRIHAIVEHVGDKTRMAAGLIRPAHHAEGHDSAPTLGQHPGDDRMHRALARAIFVRVSLLQREARTAVLQQDAELLAGDPRAEAVEDRIDEAD